MISLQGGQESGSSRARLRIKMVARMQRFNVGWGNVAACARVPRKPHPFIGGTWRARRVSEGGQGKDWEVPRKCQKAEP